MKKIIFLLVLLVSFSAKADWHSGKVLFIAVGYDGKTISIGQEGFDRTDCTCYPTWPNRYCLDRSRESFKEEYALLLSAKARGKSVGIHIEESTCRVLAVYED